MTDITLFPQPQQLELAPGQFTLDADTRIITGDIKAGEWLAAYLRPATGFDLPVYRLSEEPDGDNTLQLLHLADDTNSSSMDEAYTLVVSPDKVVISAAATPGLMRGMQTLRQLLPPQILAAEPATEVEWTIPALSIADAPAFGWRGLHLDVGRHLFPLEFIKKFIDLLAFYKFNTFHWHLTEDQGWRIDIKKYPKLTEIGAWRQETVIPKT